MRPLLSKVPNPLNPQQLKRSTRSQFVLRHLRDYKFNYNFSDTINHLYSCGSDIRTAPF